MRRDIRSLLLLSLLFLPTAGPALARDDDFQAERNRLVDREVAAAGVKDPRVLKSIRDTPRHEFMPLNKRDKAYYDMAVAIGDGQTISPPFVVAYMTEQLKPQPTDTVLEIGTGSGYQAAVLSPLVKDVYSIEIVKPLGERAARTLKRLKYANVHTKIGDGYQGWPEHAPFDKIIVTCSPDQVPPKLVEQLREGGRMIVPVGERYSQRLYLFEKKDGELTKVGLLPTLFVPMTGAAEANRRVQPDATKPAVNNGGFEEIDTTTAEAAENAPPIGEKSDTLSPIGWHYQRQTKVGDTGAPEGKYYLTFENKEPSRPAQALQGLAVDGRKVHELSVSLWVKATDIRFGSDPYEQPVLGIIFYDDKRTDIGYQYVGPWRDSFDWQKVSETIRVPVKTREIVVRIGLFGATGTISFDDIRIQAAK